MSNTSQPGAGSVPVAPVARATAASEPALEATVLACDQGTDTLVPADTYAPVRRPTSWSHPVVRQLAGYLLGCLLAGLVAGVVWNKVVVLPVYTMGSSTSLGASTSERGLTAVFASDAWFSLIGAVLGLVAGLVAWRLLRRLGWPVTLVAVVGSLLAAVACWRLGVAMGPTDFDGRIARATAGQAVPVDFALRSLSALLVWPFFATIPVMLFSSLGHDEQEAPVRRVLKHKVLMNRVLNRPVPGRSGDEPGGGA